MRQGTIFWGTLVLLLVAAYSWPPSRNLFLGNGANLVGVMLVKAGKPEDALAWYRRAAERGNETAQFNLGFALHQGVGSPVDEAGAIQWYTLAAAQGNALAANNLAAIYLGGDAADLNKARTWLLRARELGDRELVASVDADLELVDRALRSARQNTAPVASAPRSKPPTVDPRRAQRQTSAAYKSVAGLQDAVKRYWAETKALPSPASATARADLAPVETLDARGSLGAGGSINVVIKSGPLDGQVFSLIPMPKHGQLEWVCARETLPKAYFGAWCH